MARNRDPFTKALSSLRDRIQSGVLRSGSPVIVHDEAQRLQVSTTPIREALARLSGEGLVERATAGGYVTMRLDAPAVRDRYAMQGQYLHFAIRLNQNALGGAGPPPPVAAHDPVAAVSRLFSTVVCSTGNQVLWEGFIKVSRQLEALRRLEPVLFADLHTESKALHEAFARDFVSTFLDVSDQFHARRVAAAGVMAALIIRRDEAAARDARRQPHEEAQDFQRP